MGGQCTQAANQSEVRIAAGAMEGGGQGAEDLVKNMDHTKCGKPQTGLNGGGGGGAMEGAGTRRGARTQKKTCSHPLLRT